MMRKLFKKLRLVHRVLLCCFIFFLLFSTCDHAIGINTTATGYKVDPSTTIYIVPYGTCYEITNTAVRAIFVPTKTQAEFNLFKAAVTASPGSGILLVATNDVDNVTTFTNCSEWAGSFATAYYYNACNSLIRNSDCFFWNQWTLTGCWNDFYSTTVTGSYGTCSAGGGCGSGGVIFYTWWMDCYYVPVCSTTWTEFVKTHIGTTWLTTDTIYYGPCCHGICVGGPTMCGVSCVPGTW